MNSKELSSRSNRIALLCAVLAIGPACFRGADVSKIVCNDTKYCPGGYICVVPPGKTQGSCERPWDSGGGGGLEAIAIDGPGVDGPRILDSAALDVSGGGVDQALANADTSASPVDTSVGGDVSPADVAADTSIPLIDSAVADSPLNALPDAPPDLPMVAEVAADMPGRDAPLKVAGASCGSSSECASTYCADGVCCDGPCTGQCQACAEANKVGTCSTVSGAPRGARAACTATQATCAGTCAGLPNQCTYAGSETTCSAATCSTELAVKTASVCNGAGACTASSVVSCASGKYCTGGSCVTQTGNGGTCSSSNQCTSGNCSNNLCCASTETGCGTSCVALSSSNANCGSCGRACAAGSSCSGGSCYLTDGQSCTSGPQCLGGVCSTFYLDSDGDGYGVGVGVSQCGTTPPTGYAKNAGDCCDSDANAHPGQTAYFTTADACGSFDYNCDGQETPKSHGPTDCGTPTCAIVSGSCTYMGGCTCGDPPCTTYTTTTCGSSYTTTVIPCQAYGTQCEPFNTGGPYGTQECN